MTDFKAFDAALQGDPKAEEDAVERALFLVVGKAIILLHGVGWAVEDDLEQGLGRDGEAGPWSEIPTEDGLWIWEGTPRWHQNVTWEGINEGAEPDYEGCGKAHRPTDDEMKFIKEGPMEKLFGPSKLTELRRSLGKEP